MMNINSSLGGFGGKNLIDTQSASKVAEDLFDALSKKSVDYSKVDLSRFNRQNLGIDLYNNRTNIDFQRQIAISNSGVFENHNVVTSVKSLNTLAALEAYNSALPKALQGVPVIEKTENEIENPFNLSEDEFYDSIDEVA